MERILVIKLGAFGDIVQSDGALRDIRAHHPQAHITVLTSNAYKKLFDRCPHVNAVLTDPRLPRWRLGVLWELAKKLKAGHFDLVYDLQNSSRTRFYRRWLLSAPRWCQLVRPDKSISSLCRIAQQLEQAGIVITHTYAPDLGWMCEDMSADMVASGVTRPYVALVPWCSARHPQKKWPYFEGLARRLIAAGYPVVTLPGPDELKESAGFPGIILKGPQGFYNWFQMAYVLQQARLVVGNDTGASHLAAHLGVPGLALFGPHTNAERTAIERERFKAIEVKNLAELDEATVWQRVSDLLAA